MRRLQRFFSHEHIPLWSWAAPALGWGLVLVSMAVPASGWLGIALAADVIASVHASVRHAEVVALRVGEPFGSLILALSVTLIEVALIASLIIEKGSGPSFLARDTIFATIMIILNGLVGLCLLFGAAKFREQAFTLHGVAASLATISVLTVVTLILPNYTVTLAGPVFSPGQLAFVAFVSLLLYGMFALTQTIRHREYFVDKTGQDHHHGGRRPKLPVTLLVFALLILSIGAVVVQAELLSPSISSFVHRIGAPQSLIGVIIGMIVLLPESHAALRAARANHLQTSLNLALGSALATIGLTIPAISAISLVTGWALPLGLEPKESVLLILTLMVATLSLGTGRTTVLHGAVHLVLFAVFLFTVIVP